LLAGKKSIQRLERQETFRSILTVDPEPVSNLDDSIPPALDQILGKALEKDADLGYQTARICGRTSNGSSVNSIRRRPGASIAWNCGAKRQASWREKNLPWRRVLFALVVGESGWRFYLRAKWAGTSAANEWAGAKNIQVTDTPWSRGTDLFSRRQEHWFSPAIARTTEISIYSASAVRTRST